MLQGCDAAVMLDSRGEEEASLPVDDSPVRLVGESGGELLLCI